MMDIPDNHPRKESLALRHRIIQGLENGIVAQAGLIAHGRGEAFDYLLGETTHVQAKNAQKAAVCAMLLADNPVISVNGNVCALCPTDIVKLAKKTGSKLEVNLFYRSLEREKKIRDALIANGADEVWGVGIEEKTIEGLDSERSKSDIAILKSDLVLLMLEDGDRTEKLTKMGKKVVSVDLNPMSRTAKMSDITIVDNIIRTISDMLDLCNELSQLDKPSLEKICKDFNNGDNLAIMEAAIRKG